MFHRIHFSLKNNKLIPLLESFDHFSPIDLLPAPLKPLKNHSDFLDDQFFLINLSLSMSLRLLLHNIKCYFNLRNPYLRVGPFHPIFQSSFHFDVRNLIVAHHVDGLQVQHLLLGESFQFLGLLMTVVDTLCELLILLLVHLEARLNFKNGIDVELLLL